MVSGRRLIVVLASASMVLASFGVASAHDKEADSEVAIKESAKGVKGKVTSSADFCTILRKVTVFKVKPGKDKKIGSAKTNMFGKWSLKIEHAKGKYYAKVDRTLDEFTDVDLYDHLHECNPDKSDTVKV